MNFNSMDQEEAGSTPAAGKASPLFSGVGDWPRQI
jgi:hypothetical protein